MFIYEGETIMTTYELVSTVTAIASVLVAALAIGISYSVYHGQKVLAQRQLIVPLWQYMSGLSEIDPQSIKTPQVIQSVNTLELVALCCEGQMIDTRVVKRTFSDVFIKQFDQIKKCGTLPGMTVNGDDLLRESRAASAFYVELAKEHMNRGKII